MPNFIIKPESHYTNLPALSKHACMVPFKHIEIHSHGAVSVCCYTWLPVWVGNFIEESVEDILNSVRRETIQNNMRKGCFDDCNDQCPQLSSLMNGKKNYWDIVPIEQLDNRLDNYNMNIGFSYDPSCNLQCPSCRNNLIVFDPENPDDIDGQRIKNIHIKVKEMVNILLKQHKIVNLNITGSGDAFASPLYWSYLVELASNPVPDNLRINIKTNGVMMTEDNWNDIKPLWPIIEFVEVSIDAFTEETYKIVRKNGNFKRLKKNLEVLDEMITNNCFPNLIDWQTNFVVQRDNFRELADYVKWNLTFKSKPLIWTNLLAQWHHISDERFKGMAVWQEGHVNRNELIEILKDPVFKNNQIKLGNMTSLLPTL
jgi:pyruvate-formate lyase-activating enzyme